MKQFAIIGLSRFGRRLLEELMETDTYRGFASDEERLAHAPEFGVFLNSHTLEIDLLRSGCCEAMCLTIEELTENQAAKGRASGWRVDPDTIDEEQLLKDITEISKGRFAQRLARYLDADSCPAYILEAIEYVATRC